MIVVPASFNGIPNARAIAHVALWAMASAIAMFFALLIQDSTIVGDLYIPRTNDSFYHARRIIDAVVGDGFYQFEERINPPDGIWIPWPWGYDYLMSRLLQVALWISPNLDPMAFLSYVPVAWIWVNAALFLAAASAARLSVGMRILAMIAFALSPLTQLLHGIAMLDHHFIEHSFVLLCVWLGLEWMRRPASLNPALGVGIALGAAPAFHNGLFLLQLIPLTAFLVLWLRGTLPPRRTLLAFGISLLLTTQLIAIPSATLRAGYFAFGYLSWFHVYIGFCTVTVTSFMGNWAFSLRYLMVLAVVALLLSIPALTQFLLGATFLSGSVTVLNSITEAQSPWRLLTETLGMDVTLSYYSWLLMLVPIVLASGVFRLVRETSPERVYFASASVIGLTMMLMQFRFYYFGMFMLIAGVLLLCDQVRQKFRWHEGLVFVVCFGLLVAAYQPALRTRLFEIYAIGADSKYESTISIFVRLEEVCAEEPGLVLANNNDGSPILFHSDCSVIANNFFLDAEDQVRVDSITTLMKSDPETLLSAEPAINYLFLRRDDFVFGSGEEARLDTSNRIISDIFLSDELPSGFELLTSVYALPAPDAELVTHARLYRLTRNGELDAE